MAWPLTAFAGATRWQVVPFDWRADLLLSILICAVLATAIAFTVQLWAQQYTSPGHAAILFALEPVLAVITCYVLLHERLNARAIKGACLVVAGIVVAELLAEPAAAEAPEPVFAGRVCFKPWWRSQL